MFWMLQECLNFLTLNSFVRFWGFSRRQREFDLEDEFVPVVGKRNQLRASDTLSTVAFETPSFEVQCFELNGTAPNGHVDVSGSGSSSFRSSSKATAAAVIPSRLTIAPKTTGGSMGARVERANGGGGPAPTIMVESMSMHSVDEIANSVSDCSSAHQDQQQMYHHTNDSDERRNSGGMSASELDIENGCTTGRLRVAVNHTDETLMVTVSELAQLTDEAASQRGNYLQIRVALLSCDGHAQKAFTKFVAATLTPTFTQIFAFVLPQAQLPDSVIRFRLYVRQRQKRNAFCAGESFLRCCSIDPESKRPVNHFLTLKSRPPEAERSMSLVPSILSSLNIGNTYKPSALPRGNSSSPLSSSSARNSITASSPIALLSSPSAPVSRRGSTVDESGRFCSLPQADGSPEVLLSLCYFEDQSKLVVGVQKASGLSYCHQKEHQNTGGGEGIFFSNNNNHQANPTMGSTSSGLKLFDSYMKVQAMSQSGTEIGKSKSEVVRASAEPAYNMHCAFNIPRSDLEMSYVQIKLFTYQGIFRRKVLVGCVSVGEENCSSPDAQNHWREMITGIGITIDKWHKLELTSKK